MPSRDEVGGDWHSGNLGEFSSVSSVWGSRTVRVELARRESFVACCLDCGRAIKQIIKSRGRHEGVIVASRHRVAAQDWCLSLSLPPVEHLLLSEIHDIVP